jgi:hypothetical protein
MFFRKSDKDQIVAMLSFVRSLFSLILKCDLLSLLNQKWKYPATIAPSRTLEFAPLRKAALATPSPPSKTYPPPAPLPVCRHRLAAARSAAA